MAAARRRKEELKINQKHDHHLHIVLTQEQFELLSKNAKKCGVPMRLYIVQLIEGIPVRARPSQEIKDLRTEIQHIGNNINQIARSVNAGIATEEDARYGLFMLKKINELMYQIAYE